MKRNFEWSVFARIVLAFLVGALLGIPFGGGGGLLVLGSVLGFACIGTWCISLLYQILQELEKKHDLPPKKDTESQEP